MQSLPSVLGTPPKGFDPLDPTQVTPSPMPVSMSCLISLHWHLGHFDPRRSRADSSVGGRVVWWQRVDPETLRARAAQGAIHDPVAMQRKKAKARLRPGTSTLALER
jgi:hypothetical protein